MNFVVLPISLATLVRLLIWSTVVPMVAATCDMDASKVMPTPTEDCASPASLLPAVLTRSEIRLPAATVMLLMPLVKPLVSRLVSPVTL